MNRDDAIEAAKQPIDWTDATVDTTARKATMVYSTRLPDDLATWLEDEAPPAASTRQQPCASLSPTPSAPPNKTRPSPYGCQSSIR
ncbi:hypothetical protein ACIBSS_27395 [Micromonospora aurantiaca]|uniref:Transposase n=1 Tax=Micromonospora aurantiaca (nom. illeg.) TaxID=47850 RepID=A0ABQ6U6K5_9ACTN|nr:hypothetical protein [Micromonospora aurantiaca]KAB1099036.1 hypothetical protein F6X54_32460 [Micromonospora aurantiaca]